MLTEELRKRIVEGVYLRRRSWEVRPEGTFGKRSRWQPSAREDCGGDGRAVRTPSARWPYSYMIRCRTRQHCAALVDAMIRGEDVPPDVIDAARRVLPFAPETPEGVIRDYFLDGCPQVV